MKSAHKFVVHYPKMFEEKIKHGSLVLLDDVNFKPEWKAILHGEVIENPIAKGRKEMDKHDNVVYHKYEKLKKGDKIYFHYLEADEDNIIDDNLLVDAMRVFCYVRDGVIHPYGGHVLGVPAYPEESESIEVDGKKIQAVVGKSGLVEKIGVRHSAVLTKMLYSEGNSLGLKDGDLAYMTKSSDQFYKIEGRDMFPIPESEIIGKQS